MLKNSLALEERLSREKRPLPVEETGLSGGVRNIKKRMRRRKSLHDRFFEKVKKENCWLWTAKKEKAGYGRFSIRDHEFAAHRVSYQLLKGDIPDGFTLDHTCKNPSCVNPDHLEPVTMQINLLRGNTFQARNASKTHCPRGHPYNGDNLLKQKYGGRECRACRLAARIAKSQKRGQEWTETE